MSVDAPSAWEALLAEVPRASFIPDTIWVDNRSDDDSVTLSKHTYPDHWHAVVSANAPVITQVNLGDVPPGEKGHFPSSSCSQPSIVADMLARVHRLSTSGGLCGANPLHGATGGGLLWPHSLRREAPARSVVPVGWYHHQYRWECPPARHVPLHPTILPERPQRTDRARKWHS